MYKGLLVFMSIVSIIFLGGCNIEREATLVDPLFGEEQVLTSTDYRTEIRIDFREGYTLEGLYHDEDCTDLYLEYDEFGFINAALDALLRSRRLFAPDAKEILYKDLESYTGVIETPRKGETTYYIKWKADEFGVYELIESNDDFRNIDNYEKTIYAYNDKQVYIHEVFDDFHKEEGVSYFSLLDIDLGLQESENIVKLYAKKDGFFLYTSEHDILDVELDEEGFDSKRINIPFEKDELKKIQTNYAAILFLTNDGELYAYGDEQYSSLFGFEQRLYDNRFRLIDLGVTFPIEDIHLSNSYVLMEDRMNRLFISGSTSMFEENDGRYERVLMKELDTSMLNGELEEVYVLKNFDIIFLKTTSGSIYVRGNSIADLMALEQGEGAYEFVDVTEFIHPELKNYFFASYTLYYRSEGYIEDMEGHVFYEIKENRGQIQNIIIERNYILALYEDNYVDVVNVHSEKYNEDKDLPNYEEKADRLIIHHYRIDGLTYLIDQESTYKYQEIFKPGEGMYKDTNYIDRFEEEVIVTENVFVFKKEE